MRKKIIKNAGHEILKIGQNKVLIHKVIVPIAKPVQSISPKFELISIPSTYLLSQVPGPPNSTFIVPISKPIVGPKLILPTIKPIIIPPAPILISPAPDLISPVPVRIWKSVKNFFGKFYVLLRRPKVESTVFNAIMYLENILNSLITYFESYYNWLTNLMIFYPNVFKKIEKFLKNIQKLLTLLRETNGRITLKILNLIEGLIAELEQLKLLLPHQLANTLDIIAKRINPILIKILEFFKFPDIIQYESSWALSLVCLSLALGGIYLTYWSIQKLSNQFQTKTVEKSINKGLNLDNLDNLVTLGREPVLTPKKNFQEKTVEKSINKGLNLNNLDKLVTFGREPVLIPKKNFWEKFKKICNDIFLNLRLKLNFK